MELKKEHWTKQDGVDFENYMQTLKNESKVEWTKNIINTNLPVLAIPSPAIKKITTDIKKGNFEEYLDLNLLNSFEETAIYGLLLMQVKDLGKLKTHLDKIAEISDNWATCDTIPFSKISESNKPYFFDIANEYIKSTLPFKRRIGLRILFSLVNDNNYVPKIFEIANSFESEDHYYVNMMNAWLVCELFTKHRDETIEFFKTNKLNNFTVNKAISKCRDSFRVSPEDKQMLLQFKK